MLLVQVKLPYLFHKVGAGMYVQTEHVQVYKQVHVHVHVYYSKFRHPCAAIQTGRVQLPLATILVVLVLAAFLLQRCLNLL